MMLLGIGIGAVMILSLGAHKDVRRLRTQRDELKARWAELIQVIDDYVCDGSFEDVVERTREYIASIETEAATDA
jgi:uridine kinase